MFEFIYDQAKPEYMGAGLGFFLASIAYKQGKITENGFLWAPIVTGVATQVVSSFFNRLKEDRDQGRQKKQLGLAQNNKKINDLFSESEKYFENKDFYNAMICYEKYCKKLNEFFSGEKEAFEEQLTYVNYKLALCYFQLHEFNKSENLLENLLNKITKDDFMYIAVLNLLSLVSVCLNKNEKARGFILTSLTLNKNQPNIQILFLYIQEKYDLILHHAPYEFIKGSVPYLEKESIVPNVFMLKLFGESCMKLKEPELKNAITLFEAAIVCLPKMPSNAMERAILFKLCGECYFNLSEQYADEEIVIKGLKELQQKDSEPLNIESLKKHAEAKWNLGLQEIVEAKLIYQDDNLDTIFGMKTQDIEALEIYFQENLGLSFNENAKGKEKELTSKNNEDITEKEKNDNTQKTPNIAQQIGQTFFGSISRGLTTVGLTTTAAALGYGIYSFSRNGT